MYLVYSFGYFGCSFAISDELELLKSADKTLDETMTSTSEVKDLQGTAVPTSSPVLWLVLEIVVRVNKWHVAWINW